MRQAVVTQTISAQEWDAYVLAHPGASGYHLRTWGDVISRSFGHETIFLGVRSGAGEIRGILPLVHMKSRIFGNFLVSVPFFNYGGLLCDDDGSARLLLEEAGSIAKERRAAYVELRHRSQVNLDLPARTHKVTMLLRLEKDEQSQWKRLDAKVRNQVRKAEKSGLRAVTGHIELLDGFYDVFCRNMRDLGTPVYGKDFFRNVLEAFPDTSSIISITLDGRTVASGILTWFRDTLEVPWASSNRDYREMCPNNLLYWEAIKFAIGNEATTFDFGRSTPGEGTYRFKKQWGAEPEPLCWHYILDDGVSLPELNPSNPKYRLAVKAWQRLPVGVTRVVGPRIVRFIP